MNRTSLRRISPLPESIPIGELEKPAPGVRRVALMAGGGNCSGSNDVMLGVLKRAKELGIEVVGLEGSWDFFLAGDDARVIDFTHMTEEAIEEIFRGQPGMKIGTSRTMLHRDDLHHGQRIMEQLGIEGIVGVGGDGTGRGLQNLHYPGIIPCVITPKTIDNDTTTNDVTFGFSTARQEAARSIMGAAGEVQSIRGIGVVEIYGRNNGRLTAEAAAISGDSEVICLVPEVPISREDLLKAVEHRKKKFGYAVIALSEGFHFLGEGQSTTGKTDGAGNVQLTGKLDDVVGLLEGQFECPVKGFNAKYLARSAPTNPDDLMLCELIGKQVMDLVDQDAWGNTITIREETEPDGPIPDDGLQRLVVGTAPLHAIDEGNNLDAEEEFDGFQLRLSEQATQRVRIAHFGKTEVHVEEVDYDGLAARDRVDLEIVDRDPVYETHEGVTIPTGVIQEEDEAERPLDWHGYFEKAAA